MGWKYFSIWWSFIKTYNKESDEGYFLEGDVQYTENLHKLHNDLHFLLKKWRLRMLKDL